MSLTGLLNHIAELYEIFSVVGVKQMLCSSHPRLFELLQKSAEFHIVPKLGVYLFWVDIFCEILHLREGPNNSLA